MNINIADIRKDYTLNGLDISEVFKNPFDQFQKWFDEAIDSQILEPNGMVLSTITETMRLKSRVVLLKGFDERGFTFFTNYNSTKGQNIAHNPTATLNFWWVALERQVRIEGQIIKTSEQESDQYFNSRPRGSQIGAWVSEQSAVIENREVLTQRQAELEAQFEGLAIPWPAHWGGYRLIPDYIEFWQGRSSRLHDRIRYSLIDGKVWTIERLSP
jgi:pyridoxamine 5'-phosphate oxidase